jgi:hypothetical protein
MIWPGAADCAARVHSSRSAARAVADIVETISSRKATGEPFVVATVVRTVAATAAKAGAKAVILPDGTISEGWIGGGCARSAVLKAARDALVDGRSRLVSVQPPDALDGQGLRPGEERGGIRFAKNMCPSDHDRHICGANVAEASGGHFWSERGFNRGG